MKTWIFFLSLLTVSITLPTFAEPGLFVEDPEDYSSYYTRLSAGDDLRRVVGCTKQVIGTITFVDCTARVKMKNGESYLPEEHDKDFLCHFEYQAYNESFYRILSRSCQ